METVEIKKHAQRTVLALIEDMFFAAKLRAVAAELQIELHLASDGSKFFWTRESVSPDLIICDLHNARTDPFEFVSRVKRDERLCRVPLIGFFSHVNIELQRRALNEGYDKVLPRSAFTKQLPQILRGEMLIEQSQNT